MVKDGWQSVLVHVLVHANLPILEGEEIRVYEYVHEYVHEYVPSARIRRIHLPTGIWRSGL
jgi:hypothetical protein